ncbi:lachesin-like isoform X2 [Zophobas morio]|uniref:lachesin-like isoform X2 n=1 Tax=Zophobas morio TaxID=2755281 RepID=UPI0030828B15
MLTVTDAGDVRMTRGSASAHRPPLAALLALDFIVVLGAGFQPEFSEAIINRTVIKGREATFQCLVNHLGGYRVGWVKTDTKAIQAIHDHVITHNPRIGVSHTDHNTWNLHIKNVQEEDAGEYMCQINTDPMKSQLGYLDIVIPPDIVDEGTSGDIMIPEGGNIKLICKTKGHPEPNVHWRREDGRELIVREPTGVRTKVHLHKGPELLLSKIGRSEMGTYLCIASNGVPPSVSKRITVSVNFHPVVQVPNQLVGAPLGSDVTLECNVEASPKAINYWVRENGDMVVGSGKYDVKVHMLSTFESRMTVTVRKLQKDDAGTYRCIAKNSLGEVESSIRLYDIPTPTKGYPVSVDQDDDEEQYGSAEREDEFSNSVLERSRDGGHTTSGPRGHLTGAHENYVPADPAPSQSCSLVPMLSSLVLLLLRI